MKQREIIVDDVRWQCVQAFEGVHTESTKKAAKILKGEDNVDVVCTPSGGAQTRRLSLPVGWNESMSDDDLKKSLDGAG
jgi:hypothetical protein